MQFLVYCYAPVAQGIEHRPPEAGAAVRIRPGVYLEKCLYCVEVVYEKRELRPPYYDNRYFADGDSRSSRM